MRRSQILNYSMPWFWLRIREFFTFFFKTLCWGVWSRAWRLVFVIIWISLLNSIELVSHLTKWKWICINIHWSVASVSLFICLSLLTYLLISSFDSINLQMNVCTYILRAPITRLKIGKQIVRTNVIFLFKKKLFKSKYFLSKSVILYDKSLIFFAKSVILYVYPCTAGLTC